VAAGPFEVREVCRGRGERTNWQVALNVNNVFDKRYYLSDAAPYTAFWYGEPRNFMLRIDAKY
jgi:outer membrane receptor protein involved in Fe transport